MYTFNINMESTMDSIDSSSPSLMETFLKSYGIDFPSFHSLMLNSNAIVAGSSALALYMKQHGKNPEYVPNDMDIWVQETHSIVKIGEHYVQYTNERLFTNFLISQNYELTQVSNTELYSIPHIQRILHFQNDTNHIVQIILVRDPNLLAYIVDYFDLSICITWWNAQLNTFESKYPPLTLENIMFYNCFPSDDCSRFYKRIEKYKGRGFTMIEPPPPYHYSFDLRRELKNNDHSLHNIQAYDIWTLDDISCSSFLNLSYSNIIIKIQSQFQAFDRNNLLDFMKTKHTFIPYIGDLYNTPTNQTITKQALDILTYADYSIFELCSEYTTTITPSNTKTIYSMKCYTIAEWINKAPGVIIFPPSEMLINELQYAISSADANDHDMDMPELIDYNDMPALIANLDNLPNNNMDNDDALNYFYILFLN